jgi:hypothetical protein
VEVILTRKQKVFYALSALFSVVLLLVGRERIAELINGPTPEKVKVSTLLKEFFAIPIHQGDAWAGSPETFDKGVITGVTANISSSAPSKELLSYYLQTLPTLGWHLSSDSLRAEGQRLKFCKAGSSLMIVSSDDNATTKYCLGLVWTKFPHSAAYCATSGV